MSAIEPDISKIKTKEQFEQFVNNIIEDRINVRSKTKYYSKRRLNNALNHLKGREKVPLKTPKVICDFLAITYNCYEDDEALQNMILIISSAILSMTRQLRMYKDKEEKNNLNK